MRFEDQEGSDHVEDRRDDPAPFAGGGGGGGLGMLPWLLMGRGGIGVTGLLVLLAVAWFAGIDPIALLNGNVRTTRPPAAHSTPHAPTDDARKQFVSKVLRSTERCWSELLPQHFGREYPAPTLVLFRRGVNSACGYAGSSVGPFYCPGDSKLYLDLGFFDELDRSLGAGGDFAQAYVIAHEVGHHVQNLLGTSRKVDGMRRLGSASDLRHASARLELQADYFAGVWAHHVMARQRGKVELDIGDYEEAITAAQAIGDDTLQRRANGHVVPENFTHGTSAQRVKWFKLGYESGDPKAHDPFVEEK